MNIDLANRLRIVSGLSLAALLIIIALPFNAVGERKDWVALYGPCPTGIDTLMAERYALTVECRVADMNVMRLINPDFLWFFYISIEDAPSSARLAYCDSLARRDGVNPEVFYMHYWDYTEVELQGDTLVCPGLANATTYEDTVLSRVPIYYSNRSRSLNNLNSPHTRQYDKMWACEVLSTLPENYHVTSTVGYYDGIAWDNGSWCMFNTGRRVVGGQIAEHPTHANIGDVGCYGSGWWWEACLKPFYQSFVDTVNQAPNWHPDGKPKYSLPNIANSWTDDYATAGVAHFLGSEFVPRWDWRHIFVLDYSRRDSLSHESGVSLLYSSLTNTELSYYGYEGTYTHKEAMMNNLALHYVFSSPSSHLFHMPHTGVNPSQDGWDTLTWIGAMDYDLGDRLQSRYQLVEEGTDGRGYTYRIYSRQYQNGRVLFRTRGQYYEHFDQQTNVTLQLGGTYRELLPNGNQGNTVTSIGFRNGQGRIMIPYATNDSIPPAEINDFGAEIGSAPGSIRLHWTETGDDGMSGTASYTVIRYSTAGPITTGNWSRARVVANPPVPSTPNVIVQYDIQNLTAGEYYYLGLQTYDDAGRSSGLATTESYARGIKRPVPLFTNIDSAAAEVEVGCASINSYLTFAYEFALDTVNQFPYVSNRSPTLELSDTSVLFDSLQHGVSYYWSCRTVDVGGTDSSTWSAVTHFTLESGIIVEDLTLAHLLNPREGDTVFQSQTSFEVDYVPGLATVYFQTDEDPGFGSPLESGPMPVAAGNPTVWQPAIEVDSSGTHYWRASADNSTWTESISYYLLTENLALGLPASHKPYPYPNPFNLNQVDYVTFTDLPANSTLNIMTLMGYRVRQLVSEAGEDVMWYGRNEDGDSMASAVYLWHIEGTTYSGKVILVR